MAYFPVRDIAAPNFKGSHSLAFATLAQPDASSAAPDTHEAIAVDSFIKYFPPEIEDCANLARWCSSVAAKETDLHASPTSQGYLGLQSTTM